jgi:2-keto-4-pentenoate hydratase/2-oxohepta-3-ene-1,7-dioic acid hydratase in catechol pathway
MKMGPLDLVAYHSNYMTLHPGDLISTGCPNGARIQAGDRVGARIEGVGHVTAIVRQGEKQTLWDGA